MSVHKAQLWLTAYNRKSAPKLIFQDELVNALFVVKVDSTNLEEAKQKLIGKSSIHTIDQHASVNAYMKTLISVTPGIFVTLSLGSLIGPI